VTDLAPALAVENLCGWYGAAQILYDVTLSVGAPFENLARAGSLLENAGLLKEAGDTNCT